MLPTVPLAVVVPGGGVADANANTGGPLTSASLPAGVFSLVTDFVGTGVAVGGVHVDAANAAGAFALTPGGGGGAMPLSGLVRLCLLATCPLASAFLDLPLGVVGAGGTASVTGPPSVTLGGAPWTLAPFTVTNPGQVTLVSGFAQGPSGLAGSTAQPGGVLELVTPIAIQSSLGGFDDVRAYGVLRVEFVPEPAPASALLLALAWLSLVAARRRRAVARERAAWRGSLGALVGRERRRVGRA